MVDLLSPDVVFEEVQGKSGIIPEQSTSTFAIVGYSPRGPENQPQLFSSFNEYASVFGGFSSKSFNAYAIAAYFLNGGNRLLFSRVCHSDAALAKGFFPGTWEVDATGRGSWANGAVAKISGNVSAFNRGTASYSSFNVDISIIDSSTGLLTLAEHYEGVNLTDLNNVNYITKLINGQSPNVLFTSISGGVPAQLLPVTHTGLALGTGDGATTLFNATLAGAPFGPTTVEVLVGGNAIAEDDGNGNLVLLPGVSGVTSVSGTVNYSTGAVGVVISPAPANGAAVTVNAITTPYGNSVSATLAGGADGGTVTSADVLGANLAADNAGIYALNLIPGMMAIGLPDFAGDPTSDNLLITYCQGRMNAVAIIQPPKGVTPANAAAYRQNQVVTQTSYAAMYYPWIKVPDPLNNNRPITIPPCGHAAGRWAFTDLQANVGEAPAGVLRGQLSYIIGLERILSKGDFDQLYPVQINGIRSDANVGTALWGNKTLDAFGDFTDINIRRLFIYLEVTQTIGLLDEVFEDIGPTTFGLIKQRLDNFLEAKFLAGYFGSGVTDKNVAFKVICDQTNNPEATQLQKQIIIDEFIKPNLAAEIIHLRLQRVFDASQT